MPVVDQSAAACQPGDEVVEQRDPAAGEERLRVGHVDAFVERADGFPGVLAQPVTQTRRQPSQFPHLPPQTRLIARIDDRVQQGPLGRSGRQRDDVLGHLFGHEFLPRHRREQGGKLRQRLGWLVAIDPFDDGPQQPASDIEPVDPAAEPEHIVGHAAGHEVRVATGTRPPPARHQRHVRHRFARTNPRILTTVPGTDRQFERLGTFGHANQRAGHRGNRVALSGDERAERDVPGADAVLLPARTGRSRDLLLRDVLLRGRFDVGHQLRASLGVEHRDIIFAAAAVLKRGLDNHLIEPGEHLAARPLGAAPPRRDRGELQFLAE